MDDDKRIVIAIDGPAGSGKSTLAARLARKYGYVNIETGAMYRALALKAIDTGTPLDDGPALAKLARSTNIELQPQENGNRVLLDGRDVSARIRETDVTEATPQVSLHPPVRSWMVARQRLMSNLRGIVMEGRDIGTKVFPDAEVKIFLDADPVVRGKRRLLQGAPDGADDLSVLDAIQERDQRDRTRLESPLIAAPDAVVIDSTHLSFEDVLRKAIGLIDSKLGK